MEEQLYRRVMTREGYAYEPVSQKKGQVTELLEQFYIILNQLHSLAFKIENSEMVNAIAKEKLKLQELK